MRKSYAIEMTGKVFGELTVIERDGYIREQAAWICACTCGRKTRLPGSKLRSGRAKSCGCKSARMCAARGEPAPVKHGHALHSTKKMSPTYMSWAAMIQRCTNPNSAKYKTYGARGIGVCERWRSFVNFLADMGERPFNKTLDRVDNYKGYELSNCRWATPSEQQKNLRWHQDRA